MDSSWIASRDLCRRVALGLEPPSLLVGGARVLSVFTGEFMRADVALSGPLIAGVGDYASQGAGLVVQAGGRFVLPGYIDAHVHVESSLLSPRYFAEAVAVHGVTTALAEPHELANVLGPAAIEYFLAARKGLPLDLRLMLPSSVPASAFEAGAGRIDPEDISRLLGRQGVQGLGEVMDYAGVLGGGPVWQVVERAAGVARDGHAPDLRGRELAAYLIAGITADHETSDPEVVLERRRLGMWLLAREGSAASDLDRLMPLFRQHGLVRTALCTDDRHAATLVEQHHIDGMIGRLVREGIEPGAAIAAATAAPAQAFRLYDRGAVAPGLRADLVLVDDLAEPHPDLVIQGGRVVAREGRLVVPLPPEPPLADRQVRAKLQDAASLVPRLAYGWQAVRAIGLDAGSMVTREVRLRVRLHRGRLESDPPGAGYLALLDRYDGSGQVGTGLLAGLGVRDAALAGTVAHDSHQLLVAGSDARAMLEAARAVVAADGGLAVAGPEGVRVLPLPLGGLMTDRAAAEVARELRALEDYASRLGCRLSNPFMSLSFLSLTVIPALRITLGGMLDVDAGRIRPVLAESG
jgi:adenine deaminase